MIAELLPGEIVTAEAATVRDEEALFSAEMALIERAVPTRRAEFATARQCARRALAQLDIAPMPILRGAHREPLWPEGTIGSITHCAGYHAVAVGRMRRFHSIGIDAEPDAPLPDGVLDHISLPAEHAQLAGRHKSHFDRLLFSAKEAVYKTWFPLTHRWLDFDQALIDLHPDGTFDAEILVQGPISDLRGRWLAQNGLILTAIAVPRGAQPPA